MEKHDFIRVLFFEADKATRSTLAGYLQADQRIVLAGAYSNFWDMEARVQQHEPHVLLIDLEVEPDTPFLALSKILSIKRMYQGRRCPAIIALSQHRDDERIFKVHCAGGDISYLVKPVREDELVHAIHCAVNGHSCANDYVIRRSRELLGNPLNRANARKLTKREFMALSLLKRGFTQKEAAARMGIKSVNDTLKVIYRKLGVHNQREAENMVWYNHLEILKLIEGWGS